MKKKKAVKYEEILEYAFAFNDLTLEYNRRGELSEGQQIFYRRRLNMYSVAMAAAAVVALFLIITVISANMVVGWQIIIFLLAGLVALLGGLPMYRLWSDINQNQVEAAEGRIRLDIYSAQNTTNCVLWVGDKKFNISKDKFLALKNGDPYRIYYMKASKQILSLEWLYSDEAQNVLSADEAVDDDAFPLIEDFSEEVLRSKRG